MFFSRDRKSDFLEFASNFFKKISSAAFKLKPLKWFFGVLVSVYFIFCLPRPLFDVPTSMVLEDASGKLLGARIATDGQWRFPAADSIPQKYLSCLLEFEDRHFYYHFGTDPTALVRAVAQNLRNKRAVSGGSTLTMQVVRLARKNKARTFFNKFLETLMAIRLEMTHSKKHILGYYAANAPFGGNVVGLEAASWRYFGKQPTQLSWAESATLAVLPNAPSLIHVSKNRQALLEKRNRLLKRLVVQGKLDAASAALAQEEPLPDQPTPLPNWAPHLLERAYAEHILGRNKASRIRTTLDFETQVQANRVAQIHHNTLIENGIHNLALLILDTQTGKVMAYIGNAPNSGKEHGGAVDIIQANRSTGSILKPFLYAFAQQEGEIFPNSLITDIPTEIGGYHPENFTETYDGVIPARRALARSLNIPFVRLLNQYGLEKFYHQLKRLGITSFNKAPEHYGLTMVLGGGESSIWQVTNAYACLARTASNWYTYQNQYAASDWHAPQYLYENKTEKTLLQKMATPPVLSAASAWLTLDAMKEVERPDGEGSWELFQSSRQIAWKTGTSFGFRDAWAVGVTPRYTIGVWVGNADGEGRPKLMGIEVAAPVLFDIFNALPHTNTWFEQPYDDMKTFQTCKLSGLRATELCEKDTVWATKTAERVKSCFYHQQLHLDKSKQFQVSDICVSLSEMIHESWFCLSPLEAYYYKTKHPEYVAPPAFRTDCAPAENRQNPMQLIYPKSFTKIFIPIDFDGKIGQAVFRAAHSSASSKIYWHLDNTFITTTQGFHQISISPAIGLHKITLVDENGVRLEQKFQIIGK
jgi:penicillin-binding protein 1C